MAQAARRLIEACKKGVSAAARYAPTGEPLEQILPLPADQVFILSDTWVVVEQMCGWTTARSARLLRLHERARQMAGRCRRVTVPHVAREAHQLVDAMADGATGEVKHVHCGAL